MTNTMIEAPQRKKCDLRALTSCDVVGQPHPQVDAIVREIHYFMHHDLDAEDCAILDRLKKFSTCVVLSIGGPAMCAQILYEIAKAHDIGPRQNFVFFDNLSDEHIEFLQQHNDLKDVGVLVLSKSGQTLETHVSCQHFIEAFRACGYQPCNHFVLATEQDGPESVLGEMAHKYSIPRYRLNTDIDGRFSLFARVGACMAYLYDLDMSDFAGGGAHAVLDCVQSLHTPDACATYTQPHITYTDHVLWSYDPRLCPIVVWWAQLIGESLGKWGKGTTPVMALGPRDQHSQLQLYLGGPSNKYFTFLCTHMFSPDAHDIHTRAHHHAADFMRLNAAQLHTQHTHKIVALQMRAVVDILMQEGHPTRVMSMRLHDLYAMGYMTMRMMLEVLISGFTWGFDPFGQPDVERVKIRTKELLQGEYES